MTNTGMRVLLVDNGSLEPASTRQLRRIAAELERRIGARVEPVSVAHSSKVPASELEGRGAELLEAALERVGSEGASEVVIAPLFVGPSHAIVRHVPAVAAEKMKVFSGMSVRVAEPLFVEGERRLAEILADGVREQMRTTTRGEKPRVAVVDHGSPSRAVTAVRDAVAAQVREMLGDEVSEVAACSMERREGAEYDFNEPTLERLLARAGWREGEVVVALLFIAPGKHAGPEGDVARIVARARGEGGAGGSPASRLLDGDRGAVRFTRVMGEDPRVREILAERVCGALGKNGK